MKTPLAALQRGRNAASGGRTKRASQRTAAAGPMAAVSTGQHADTGEQHAAALAQHEARAAGFAAVAQHDASADTGDSVHAAGSADAVSPGGRAQHAGFVTSQPLSGQWFGSMWWKTANVAPPATAADAVRIANSFTIAGPLCEGTNSSIASAPGREQHPSGAGK
jgi:hypothetical protein